MLDTFDRICHAAILMLALAIAAILCSCGPEGEDRSEELAYRCAVLCAYSTSPPDCVPQCLRDPYPSPTFPGSR